MDEETALAFADLTLYVKTFLQTKVIVKELFGKFEFGSMNGLLGPSGSGKTSLLKYLSGSGKYICDQKSTIYFNDKQVIRSCFVSQDRSERLLKGLTVGQYLIYSSKLKNSDESDCDHKEIANKLLKEFMIEDIENNYIKNCSGGELKRVTIALELTAKQMPNIVYVDEPTSGLDSSAALKV